MSHWKNALEAARDLASQEDFEAAAYRLVSEQVIYASDKGNKLAYALIEDYAREFRLALEPLGVDVLVNARFRYACALPRHSKLSAATVDQTLVALVLRKIYDEVARLGQLSDKGEVFVDLVDLEVKYKQSTSGRELPRGGELKAIMRMMQRWGLASRHEDVERAAAGEGGVEQPYVVVVRPAIVDVLGEAALQRLALFGDGPAGSPSSDDAAQAQEDDE